MPLTASQIAEQLHGEVLGDGSVLLTGFAPADCARPGDLTFAEKPAYFAAAEESQATAILVTGEVASSRKVLIRVPNPRVAVARLLPLFYPPDPDVPGIHPSATIAPSAQIDPTAYVGPNCVIGARVRVGARSVLMGGNHIGRDCQIGDDVTLFPNVVIYAKCQIGHRVSIHAGTVIGSDGYGYVFDEGRHRKMLQVGNVIIHDDVEIGANAAIDRGALGATVIGQGTKIDNLVHVAHNVTIGRHCLVMGQVGFAGSTCLGDYCVIASQSGIAGHLKLGHQATVGAKSGVMRDIPDKGTVLGIPAAPDRQAKRQMIAIQQLPELLRRMRELEKHVADLKASAGG
ncbi:MAG TPA: UDP-3-O-(3-hydroxymyristoyl)glucosamine N-acyltransferase [Candidatus Baltobacteraceae bacterium]|jgi:UDP-3-O-[3-hydroxymyristoyl] glucosamine N-acyltransferase|nr:UDP-3-O-(3-hydroxymyristoyl)glucosamine N-acyltransferase [Candidatus Baltobacteraceae bacterium]